MTGYIALHRKIIDNEFYFSEKFTKTQAWIDLLLLANHSGQTVFIRNIEIRLKAGELCYSQLSLAKRWKWNFKTVKKFLNLLKNREMVETKTDNLTTIISIKNWQIYQVSRNRTFIKSISNGDQNGEQKETKTETNNNDNNVNKKIITNSKKSRIPESRESKKNKSILYSVVFLYSKIQNRSIDSSDYAFINNLLKEKQKDNISYVQKCLMLCNVLKSKIDKTGEQKYKGILFNSYRDLSYTEFCNNLSINSKVIFSNEYESFN